MKSPLLFLITLIFSWTVSLGQGLTLNDLHTISSAQNWENANQFLLKKGWEYFESSKGDSQRYNNITWSYNRSYGNKAEGWFYVYTFDKIPNKVSYTTFNKPSYNAIQTSLSTNGYKLIDSEINDDAITSKYQNKEYIISITTDKREGSSTFEETITGYRFLIVKREGVYDVDNGVKVDYHSNGKISMEYGRKNGKIHGPFKVFHENGRLKKTGSYTNGQQNGSFTEYNEEGNKISEYKIVEDKYNGQSIAYENGKKSYTTTWFDDVRSGEYVEYYYNDNGENTVNNIGQFVDDKESGEWKLIFVGDGENKVVKITNYLNGIKHGQFQDFKGDSLIVGSYSKDELHGSYNVYLDVRKMLIGGLITTDTTKLQKLTIGQFNYGKKTGNWKYYDYTQSLSSEGSYANDLKNGQWKYYYSKFNTQDNKEEPYSQELYLIENYKNGELHGEVRRLSYLNKEAIPCPEKSEKTDDCWKIKYREADDVSYYKNGLQHGPFRSSTQLTKQLGHYENGLKSGKWSDYENGELFTNYSYQNGNLNDDYLYFSDSTLVFKKSYKNGKVWRTQSIDSLGQIYMEFEYVKNTHLGPIWNRKFNLGDFKIEQEYVVIKSEEIDNPFFIFLLKENEEENYNMYKYGEYKVYDERDRILVLGKHEEEKLTGKWSNYNYEQGVIFEREFNEGSLVTEQYKTLNGELFSGKFVYKDEANNVKEERKIKNGLRHGKTEFQDIATGKTIKKDNYKNGVLN